MRIAVVLLSFLFTLPVLADWNRIQSSEFSLSPPPREGSPAYKKDFKILLAEQEIRTEEDCALSRTQKIPSFQTLYGKSKLFSKEESRLVEPFMKRTLKFAERVANYFKAEFGRPRPFNVDPRIEPCVEKPGGAKAYPSSHAAMAFLGACVLSKIFPDREERVQSYGEYLADLRVKVGVHHPSDVQAGKKLAAEMCERLMEEEDFREEVESIK